MESLKFNEEISIGEKKITNLDDYLNNIIVAIGIKEEGVSGRIKETFSKYDNKRFVLINNSNISDLINELLNGNDELLKVLDNPGIKEDYEKKDSEFKKNWDSLMEQFVRLQGLIIIRKMNKNVDAGIDSIIQALINRLTIVNNLIEQSFES